MVLAGDLGAMGTMLVISLLIVQIPRSIKKPSLVCTCVTYLLHNCKMCRLPQKRDNLNVYPLNVFPLEFNCEFLELTYLKKINKSFSAETLSLRMESHFNTSVRSLLYKFFCK